MPNAKLSRALGLTISLIHGISRPDEARAAPVPLAQAAGFSSPDQDDHQTLQASIFRLEEDARRAAATGDHAGAASLYLQAERLLPIRAANARAERIRQAVFALREAARADPASEPAFYKRALTALDGFLVDAEINEADQADVASLSALRADLLVVQDDWAAHPPSPVVGSAQPSSADPAPRSEPARSQGLTLGLGITAGLAIATAAAALGTRLRVLEGGQLHQEILLAAKSSTRDFDPSNDVSLHAPDICDAVRDAGGAGHNEEVNALCRQHRSTLHASNGLWIAAGVLAGASMALLGLLLARRRRAQESNQTTWVDGGANRHGVMLYATVRF